MESNIYKKSGDLGSPCKTVFDALAIFNQSVSTAGSRSSEILGSSDQKEQFLLTLVIILFITSCALGTSFIETQVNDKSCCLHRCVLYSMCFAVFLLTRNQQGFKPSRTFHALSFF